LRYFMYVEGSQNQSFLQEKRQDRSVVLSAETRRFVTRVARG